MNTIRNLAIAAHVDAGKTTLTEQILYTAGKIRKLGNVHEGTSQMDWQDIEKRRGITVFSEQASLEWQGVKINLLDTPGHIDFYSELERSLSAVDAILMIISAVDGVQQYTETVLDLAKKYRLPVLFFVNKMDREIADFSNVLKDLERVSGNILPLQQIEKCNGSILIGDALTAQMTSYRFGDDKTAQTWDNQILLDTIVERLAENDDLLMLKYLEAKPITQSEILRALDNQIRQDLIRPVLAGSAAWGAGIEELLDKIVEIMPPPTLSEEENSTYPSGLVYKVRRDEKEGFLAYVRLFSGELHPRDNLWVSAKEQKVNQLRIYQGSKYVSVNQLIRGDLGVILGLDQVKAGDIIGDKETEDTTLQKNAPEYFLTPVLSVVVKAKDPSQKAAVRTACAVLTAEDPLLAGETVPGQENLRLTVTGKIQIEILKELLQNRFGLDIEVSEPEVAYFETITAVSTGFCHYEPKKHYAEVEVELAPLPRGEGIHFLSAVSTDDLPIQYQNAVRKSVPEALQHGALAGSPLRDVQVKLIAGKHHLEHTHGGDFRIATIRAVQQALENNSCILLEPLNEVKITAGQELAGRILSDILKMHGTYEEPCLQNGKAAISGLLPVSTSLNYPIELNCLSSGTARAILRPGGLQECHNPDEVLEILKGKADQQENAGEKDDILYNSVSLFRQGRKMLKITNE